MMNLNLFLEKAGVEVDESITNHDGLRLLAVKLPDGSVVYVRGVLFETHPKTGEPVIVLDTREMV